MGVGENDFSGVVTFERFDEGLRDRVAFGRADRREGEPVTEGDRHRRRRLGDIGTPIIGEPFDRMRCFRAGKTPFDRLDH